MDFQIVVLMWKVVDGRRPDICYTLRVWKKETEVDTWSAHK